MKGVSPFQSRCTEYGTMCQLFFFPCRVVLRSGVVIQKGPAREMAGTRGEGKKGKRRRRGH